MVVFILSMKIDTLNSRRRMKMKLARLFLIAFFSMPVILPAQSNPGEARVPGIIDMDTQSQFVIETPKSVKAGNDFEVKILTLGGGCEREGDTTVIQGENDAAIFVYDFTSATKPDVPCTKELKRLSHRVTLQFKKAGEVIIRLWGRRIGSDTPPGGEPMILEKKIVVE
jgi:hypothetical protein